MPYGMYQALGGGAAINRFGPAVYGDQPFHAIDVPDAGLQATREQLAQQRDLLPQQQAFQAQQAAAQRDFAGGQSALDRQLQGQLGMAPWDYKNKVFGTISPLLQGLIGPGGQAGGVGLFGGGQRPGGENTPQTPITQGPVWNDQQIGQQVNAQKAANAGRTATTMRSNQEQLAGQGWGTRSPLLAALNSGARQAQMGADATADRETRWGAAQGNAQHLLATQQAGEGQWRDWNDADIRRRTASNQYTTGLLGALGGLI